MRNVPDDHAILAAVNEMARQFCNADMQPEERERAPLPEGYRCDMSRVRFIRRRWEWAVRIYWHEQEIDPIEALMRIEARLRDRDNAPVLHR